MEKNSKGDIIGAGEKTALSILQDLFKGCIIKPQYPLIKLLTEEYKDSLSDSYLKHKVDIMIFRSTDKPIAVRVQGKTHNGVLKSARDTVQKKIMEWHDCIVVDLDWEECPYLFNEDKSENSYLEVLNALNQAGLHF